VDLAISGHPVPGALYRFAWINVKNGSTFNYGTFGGDADHYIQMGGLRLVIPIKGSFGVGGDAYVFLRNSDDTFSETATGRQVFQHIGQRNPQVRF
jgi:hypothetical protein